MPRSGSTKTTTNTTSTDVVFCCFGWRLRCPYLLRDTHLLNLTGACHPFGQNVASYKFCLAKSLLEVSPTANTFIPLEDLSEPFSRHILEHLKKSDKKITSKSSTFIDACRQFNAGILDKDELIRITVKYGYANVLDAFHVVNREEIPVKFFEKVTDGKQKGNCSY